MQGYKLLILYVLDLRGFVDTSKRCFDLRLHNQYAVLYVLFFLQLHMFIYLCTQ
jgi:hypothetical protein